MRTDKHICTSAVLMCLSIFGMKAQDYPMAVLDGPAQTIDSLSVKPSVLPSVIPGPTVSHFSRIQSPSSLSMPLFETKEQRAARINEQTFISVMESVDNYLLWYRPPKLARPWKQILGAAKLFLSNPSGFPEGCVPLMNTSFPFIYAKTPGMAPFENIYTSSQFPKCIDTEFDYSTRTYKQVMVDWSEVQNRTSTGNVSQSYKPVPSVRVTPVERVMH